MRGISVTAASFGILLALSAAAAEPDPLWTIERASSGDGATLRLDLPRMRALLSRAPMDGTAGASAPIELTLPMPDGRLVRFSAVESPILEPALAAQYPEIRTYAATGIEDRSAVARFDLMPSGFHALVLGPGGTAFVEPATDGDLLRYRSAPRQRSEEGEAPVCDGDDLGTARFALPETPNLPAGGVTTRSNERRIYHLVAGATGEFTDAHGDTVESAFQAITTTINGVNTIFRRDIGIHLELQASSRNIIFTDGNNDLYVSGDRTCDIPPPSCLAPTDCLLTQNQCAADLLVGNANYDLAVVFDQSNGGVATVGSVCDPSNKGRGAVTDSVGLTAHEIGHMFGARHSFNGTTDTCAGNRLQSRAVEPGSGTTIMSYAGVCGAENVDNVKDLNFHHSSFLDMLTFSTGAVGDSCPGYGFTGNYAPIIQGLTAGPYTIPRETPFALSVQAYDPNSDPISYSWEQYDTGGASPPQEDDGTRTLFRAFPPTDNPERWFPERDTVIRRQNSPADVWFCGGTGSGMCIVGEKMPTTTRTMHFNVILRDGQDGVTVGFATVGSHSGSGPFVVTQPAGLSTDFTWWTKGASREVKWNVANTNQAPVSCASVRILLSTDDGSTWPYVLAASTPNDGSEFVTLPFENTSFGRIKVEAVGNVFFDVSDQFGIMDLRVTNTNDSGQGSLRQAIADANSWPTGATIPFSIPGTGVRTINVASPLPAFAKEISLDGWSLGGEEYVGPPLLELNGAGCFGPNGTPCDGLVVQANYGFVNGVIVNRFSGNGIVLRGSGNQQSLVQNCYVGTTADGTADAGNAASGILIDGSHDNLLWGNVISGNLFGVTIQGTTATANHLQRNYIGTNAAGTARIWNDDDGVRIMNAPGNTVGGSSGDERNVIAGNGRFNLGNAFVETYADGVEIQGAAASGNVIQGNYFGLNATGTSGLDNTESGVRINGAPNTLVGGTTAAARNVFGDSSFINYFAGHGVLVLGAGSTGTVIQGNYMGTDATGTVKLGIRGACVFSQTPGVQIGGDQAGAGNVLVNCRNYAGIYLDGGASGAQIQGNYIGTDATGSVKFGMPVDGITAYAGNNAISGNVIAGTAVGINVRENAASGNTIQGNLIGTNAAGTQDFGSIIGIQLLRTGNNLIGGTTAAARNVISGNDQFGIYIPGPPGPAGPNVVQGNYIGTNAAGTAAIANQTGVSIYETINVTFGGAAAGAGNLVSGNQGYGVDLGISDPATGIILQGNRVGTNAAGTAALPNGGSGLHVGVNGAVSILDNLFSGNGQNGVEICCRPTTALIQGNKIGTDVTGTLAIPNTWNGIDLSGINSVVGGVAPGQGNVIAFNQPGNTNYSGLHVSQNSGHRVRGNSILSNFGLGIDLGNLGVQPNDACDTDNGANNLQNYPVLTAANLSGPGTVVTGTLNSTASTTFDVDLYASPSCDGSGFGEGATYLGSTTVTTNASCSGSFTASLPASVNGVVTAIAVDPAGNSSEFSQCRVVQPSPVAEVTGVTWTSKTDLSWSAAAGAVDYRVLRGVAADFGNLLDQDADGCERAVIAGTTTGSILTEDPLSQPGRLYWYVVVGRNGSVEGPAGAASAGPRLANPSGTCP